MSERVLVTGAAGFIGGRVVERLRDEPGVEVLAGVRGWKGCARVARLGVPLVRCDLMEDESVGRAVTGVQTVIHCAMSDGPSIIDGTRRILEAARASGVGKVVHLSTGDVYSASEGTVSEDGARELVGDWYSDAKRLAEETCAEFGARGLSVTWLRPGIVYGPFCYAWTQRIGMRLAAGQVMRLRSVENGVCNAVFVDDVVEACIALRRPGFGDGEGYNINGPERISWNDYLDAFAKAMGAPPIEEPKAARTGVRSLVLEPARQAARAGLKRFQGPIMALYTRNRLANRLMRRFEAALKATPEAREMRVYGRRTYFDDGRLRTHLPELPKTPLAEGMRTSAEYLRMMGLVEQGRTAG